MAHQDDEPLNPDRKSNDFGSRSSSIRAFAAPPTLEDRLAAKAAMGDLTVFAGPSLDEMTREERHKLLYGA